MNFRIPIIFFVFVLLLAGCSGTEKFTGKDEDKRNDKIETPKEKKISGNILNPVRVLLGNSQNELIYQVTVPVSLYDSKNRIATIKPGNKLFFKAGTESLTLRINDQKFDSGHFELYPVDSIHLISFNSRHFRGRLRFLISNGEVRVINIVNIEDYLKGVLPSEMPIGKEEKNLEALKAFSICARTYSLMKLNQNKKDFDLFIDVRDQVYGGADNEKALSNRAVEETRGMSLFYGNSPAVTYYHSTCGGETENSVNLFTQNELPYLTGVIDGEPPLCSISPRFVWKETFDRREFLNRFVTAGIIPDTKTELESIEVKSRFTSDRVNELEITIVENESLEKKYSVFGNNIRSIVRTADKKSILFSTMFKVFLDGDKVIIEGHGYGHGVGMCQYGAIGQSHAGRKYLDILYHYFPGTQVKKYYE